MRAYATNPRRLRRAEKRFGGEHQNVHPALSWWVAKVVARDTRRLGSYRNILETWKYLVESVSNVRELGDFLNTRLT